MPGEAEYFLQLPGRYPHHGVRAQRAGRDHLAGTGDAGIRLPRRGVPPAETCLLPDAGAGVFQDGKLGGEPDTAGISEIHPAAKGSTADKIRIKSGGRYNDPIGYADLVLNGNPETYLKTVTEYKSLD